MDNPHQDELSEHDAQPTGRIIPGRFIPPPGFEVSFREWNHIKQSVKGIRSNESWWLSAIFSSLSAGIAFAIGAISLGQIDSVSSWLLTFFWTMALSGFLVILVCWFGYRESRKRKEDGIGFIITYMDDIAANYTDESADPSATTHA